MPAKFQLLGFVFISPLLLFSQSKSCENFYCQALQDSYRISSNFCQSYVKTVKEPEHSLDIDSMMAKPTLNTLFFSNYWDFSVRKDVGRVRLYSLLKLIYGQNQTQIEKNLVWVDFLGKKILFNSKNQAAQALKKTSAALTKLIQAQPRLKKYLAGADTYYYRKIAGTSLLSAHSFGIAVDLNPGLSQYWRTNLSNWQTVQLYYPLEIVEIFEQHGFIWGGRWEHFDTMHFEYRPEFLALKKIQGQECSR